MRFVFVLQIFERGNREKWCRTNICTLFALPAYMLERAHIHVCPAPHASSKMHRVIFEASYRPKTLCNLRLYHRNPWELNNLENYRRKFWELKDGAYWGAKGRRHRLSARTDCAISYDILSKVLTHCIMAIKSQKLYAMYGYQCLS